MTINNAYSIGDTVYFAANTEYSGIVTSILVLPGQNNLQYWVTWSDDRKEELHFAFELANEKNYAL